MTNLLRRVISEVLSDSIDYHVAPTFARRSIRKLGLDPSRADANFSTGEDRVFVFRDKDEAKWYANYQSDNEEGVRFDIWEVDTSGLRLYDDDSMFSPGAEGETSAAWTPQKIGRRRVKLYQAAPVNEAIGRNMHTTDTTPNTWDSFQDFEVNYYPQADGFHLMDVSFKGKKLGPTRRFNSQSEAQHQARMIIDQYRVQVMNSKT